MSFKEDYERAMTGDGLDQPEETPVEKELRALRKQVASIQDQLTPKLKRSQMKDKEKADYIRAHGGSAYFKLPWD